MTDVVNHPPHYTAYKGLEIIDLTEQLNFCRGNAVKYIARAGLKNPDTEIEDLEKAAWYINREIGRIKKLKAGEHRCPAHGSPACRECSRTRTGGLDGDECRSCGYYGETGMHWDTCQYRIRGGEA